MATPLTSLTSLNPQEPLLKVSMRRDKVEKYRDWGNGGYCSGKTLCGEGMYKKVYKVELYPSRQTGAIAKVKFHRSYDVEAVLNEVAMHKRFQHLDNVMPLYHPITYFSNKLNTQRAFYVMPYCCYDLTNAPLSTNQKTKVLLEVCTAISCIHQLGYVISDLKGSNIMIQRRDEGYRPLLGDLAGVFHESTPPPPVKTVITWTHTSPEAAIYRYGGPHPIDQPLTQVTRAHDMWSLSILLYECWTATKYENCTLPTFKKFAMFAINREYRTAAKLIPSVMEEFITTFTMHTVVADLIKKGLSLDPAARGTIDNFITVLRPVLYPSEPEPDLPHTH